MRQTTARARAGWTIADQTASSFGNAALSLLVATTVSPATFGVFAICFSIYGFVLGVGQSLAGQVMAIRYATNLEGQRFVVASGRAAGAAVALGAAVGVLLVPCALLAGAHLRNPLLCVGFALPVVLLQDTYRSIFVVRGTPRQAFVNDALWTAMQLVGVVVLRWSGHGSLSLYLVAWGVSGLLAAALAARQAGQRPALTSAWAFVKEHRDLSTPLLGQWIAQIGSAQIAFLVIAAFGSYGAVGAIRGAQTLLGPVNILAFGLMSFAVPELARGQLLGSALRRAAVGIGMAVAALNLIWGVVLLLAPPFLGRTLLGPTWDQARGALPGLIVFGCLGGLTLGCSAVFRALDQARRSLLLSAILGPLTILSGGFGVVIDGSEGAAWAFAAAAALMVVPTWVTLKRAVAAGRSPRGRGGGPLVIAAQGCTEG